MTPAKAGALHSDRTLAFAVYAWANAGMPQLLLSDGAALLTTGQRKQATHPELLTHGRVSEVGERDLRDRAGPGLFPWPKPFGGTWSVLLNGTGLQEPKQESSLAKTHFLGKGCRGKPFAIALLN